jgi:NAD(P)-dependent dehydrogenase (short-subunit alcohol dehydrogenase family)
LNKQSTHLDDNMKVALVTAAGKGMGAAIARELNDAGYQLGLMSNSGGAEELAAKLGGFGFTGSVTELDDLEHFVEQALNRFGQVDAVVNNTGHPPKGELLEISDSDWHLGLDLVLLNVIRMAKLVTPVMEAQGGGSFVNISTFAAFEPSLDFPVSSSLRTALGSFVKLYSDRYAAGGIRMNNVLPGFIDSYPESEENLARIPMGRYGRVEEVAKTTRFLLSEEASYITGQNIRVEGGITRSV